MTAGPAPGELAPLAPGVLAWISAASGHGAANAGVVVDEDGLTVIDALMVPSEWEPFGAAVDAIGRPVRRVVLTSSNVEFAGGTSRFRLGAIYGRAQASTHLDQPADPELFRRLHPRFASEFDDEFRTRPVSHVVDAAVQLTPAVALVPMTGQQEENLVAIVPGAAIAFAGAMCSFGVTPNAGQGNPAQWADELDRLLELAPIIVPGHGPIGGAEEVGDLQAYLRAVVAAEGDPARLADGPWRAWSDREWDEVNVERAALLAAGRDEPPPSLLRRLGLATP
jgi:glyoxylase-like metal-dependent hydrolase (beta-lactamase superfamily II)